MHVFLIKSMLKIFEHTLCEMIIKNILMEYICQPRDMRNLKILKWLKKYVDEIRWHKIICESRFAYSIKFCLNIFSWCWYNNNFKKPIIWKVLSNTDCGKIISERALEIISFLWTCMLKTKEFTLLYQMSMCLTHYQPL